MDPFSVAGQVAQGGFGYVLFLFMTGLMIWREKQNNDEKKELRNQVIIVSEKRLDDLKQIQEVSYARTKEEREFYNVSTDKLKSAIDTLAGMIGNVQTLLSSRKNK